MHAPAETGPIPVAPTDGDGRNVLREPLQAVACVQLKDVRFGFDSSFVRADAREEFALLAQLRVADALGGTRPISIFGHADPVGDDDYNKKLSGRRARAVHALLVRNAAAWEELHSTPIGGDDWRSDAIPEMRAALTAAGHPAAAETGATAASRATLFAAYMDLVCVDEQGAPFRLDPAADFLGGGGDPGGKADFQGCSEFNPVLVFSAQEHAAFASAQDKTARNQANAPNRRVTLFLFRPGSKVDPTAWPCPRAGEGVAACRKRFHVDGDRRRGPQERRRERPQDTDTFACRFFDVQISRLSPCEDPRPRVARFCCKHRGIVVDNVDPLGQGRLRVRVADVFPNEDRFALPALPLAAPDGGFLLRPPIGASVWVEFEEGDPDRPIWSGCFWAAGEMPPELGSPQRKAIKTESFELILDDGPAGGATLAVTTGPGLRIALRAGGVEISGAGAKITLEGPIVSFNDGALEVI